MNTAYLIALSLLILSGCAVEAGNPTGKKPKGTAAVSFVQTTSLSGDQFTISLDSIALVSSSGDTSSTQNLNVSQTDLNLLSTSPTADSTEAAKADVEVGTYSGVIIKLPARKPPRYRSSAGVATELGTDKLDEYGFRIDQDIQIKEGESTSIIVRLDPLGSMTKDGERIRFDPRGDASPRPPAAQYSGTAPIADALYVCAYGYGLTKMPLLQFNGVNPTGRSLPPPPPPGGKFAVRSHQSYSTRTDVVFDTSSTCSNAFAKTSVKEKSFILDRLLPGSYALRFFRADDSYVDQTPDITVSAPSP